MSTENVSVEMPDDLLVLTGAQVEPLRITKASSTSPAKSPPMSRPLSEVNPMGIRRNSPSIAQNTSVGYYVKDKIRSRTNTPAKRHRSKASAVTLLPSRHPRRTTPLCRTGKIANRTRLLPLRTRMRRAWADHKHNLVVSRLKH